MPPLRIGPVIGMAVNIQPWKGQDVTLRAMVEVAAEFPGLVCLLAGGVVRGAEPYAAALDEFIRTAGLAGRVQFLGTYTKPQLADLLAASDCFVYPSRHETFGIVPAEAMAAGLPVIGPDRTAPPEFIDSRCGCGRLPAVPAPASAGPGCVGFGG